jgi:S-adenosylmethionine:tRNA ribosyltransferase-isomerase
MEDMEMVRRRPEPLLPGTYARPVAMDGFDYPLPAHAIAQVPAEPRDSARLLVDLGPDRGIEHSHVSELWRFVRPGDLLVVNDTRVRPARLRLRRATGGAAEVLVLEPAPDGDGWLALVRPSRRIGPGETLAADGGGLAVEVAEPVDGGRRRVRLRPANGHDDEAALAAHGSVPLPPYITTPLADPERYQTVYAARPGSAAAPTAGLHLTDAVLAACRRAGAAMATVELAIGLDTFRPVTADRADDHVMHTEAYRVPPATMAACRAAGRVVAVGTTTVRALEAAAATGQLAGRTDLFIHGDYPFRVVDRLLTNFHQPRSSLLLLLAALVGDRWRALYDTALAEGYRFLSFGDCMLVDRRGPR